MRLLAALLVSSPLLAQAVSLGLRAGIPITPALTAEAPPHASTPRFTAGALVEFRLWRGAGLGADFLMNRSDKVWRWELPVTFIYRFRAPARPFVRAGISLDRVLEDGSLAELRHRGTSGFVAGGGLGFRIERLRLEPEVRLTRWIDRNFGVRDSAVRSNLSQIEFLVGVIL